MAKLFISYRREDSDYQTDRLHSELLAHVASPDDIFMDINSIPFGVDFVSVLNEKVGQCDVLLAVIGRHWLTCTDPQTCARRLDNPNDFVRLEIASALQRGVPVVPVLLDGTPMPQADQLPEDLKALARRNGVGLGRTRFAFDVATLVSGLPLALDGEAPAPDPAPDREAEDVAAVAPVPDPAPDAEPEEMVAVAPAPEPSQRAEPVVMNMRDYMREEPTQADVLLVFADDQIDPVNHLFEALGSAGVSVWWNGNRDFEDFDHLVELAAKSKAVVMMWSREMLYEDSLYLLQEADALPALVNAFAPDTAPADLPDAFDLAPGDLAPAFTATAFAFDDTAAIVAAVKDRIAAAG